MKLSRFFMLGCILTALAFTACSGEDGKDGLPGNNGDNGTNGDPGVNGVNCWDANSDGIDDPGEDTNNDGSWDVLDCQGPQGEQGNANVQQVVIDLSDHTGTLSVHTVEQITDDVLTEDAILYYLAITDIGTKHFSIPGFVSGDYEVEVYAATESVNLSFRNPDGQGSYPITEDDNLDYLKIIIIDGPSLASKSSNSTKKVVLDELKLAGIDINDYNSVAEYYNLD